MLNHINSNNSNNNNFNLLNSVEESLYDTPFDSSSDSLSDSSSCTSFKTPKNILLCKFIEEIDNTNTNFFHSKYFRKKPNKTNIMTNQQTWIPHHIKTHIHTDANFITNVDSNNNSFHSNDFGQTSNLTKETPFIKYLINKRIKFCQLGASSHIAAFIPVSINLEMLFYQSRNFNAIIGENSNNPLYSNSKIRTHAEMEALEKAKGLLRCKKVKKNKMNLVVLRINKIGELCESAPCFHCTKKLGENDYVQIYKLYYSRYDGTITCVKFNKWVCDGKCHISKGWKWLQRENNM